MHKCNNTRKKKNKMAFRSLVCHSTIIYLLLQFIYPSFSIPCHLAPWRLTSLHPHQSSSLITQYHPIQPKQNKLIKIEFILFFFKKNKNLQRICSLPGAFLQSHLHTLAGKAFVVTIIRNKLIYFYVRLFDRFLDKNRLISI